MCTDGSVCERAHIEWRSFLCQVCDDLTSHLTTRLHSTCHVALKQDQESLTLSSLLPHTLVPAEISDNIPDCPRLILQANHIISNSLVWTYKSVS